MAKEHIICGLDIGTAKTRAVVLQYKKGAEKLSVVGVGEVLSSGVRRGVVSDMNEVSNAISEAVGLAEKTSGREINSVFVNLSGSHIGSRVSKGVVAVSRADQEISQEDVNRVLQTTEAVSIPPNRKIVHVIPKEFMIDGEGGVVDPLGMKGIRLEVNALVVDCSVPVINNVTKAVSDAGLDLEELVVSPLASSKSVLSKRQKELGVMVLDMGAGTTSMSIYEDGSISHVAVLPIGASHITNDIAIGLRTEVDVAEKIKLEHGTADVKSVNKKEMLSLAEFGLEDGGSVSKRHVAEIIRARLDETFELIYKELKKVSKQGLLPGGVVLVGGGAKMPYIVELAKEKLKLPVQIGFPNSDIDGILDNIADPEYASVLGLGLFGFDEVERDYFSSSDGAFGKIKKFFKTFMP